VITFNANDTGRVSTLATTQAIIFLEPRGGCLLVKTLVTRLRAGKDHSKLEKQLEGLILVRSSPNDRHHREPSGKPRLLPHKFL
jgi:hypothetical protein